MAKIIMDDMYLLNCHKRWFSILCYITKCLKVEFNKLVCHNFFKLLVIQIFIKYSLCI